MRRANGTGHVFKMKGGGRRNPWRVRITVGWELDEVTGKSKQSLLAMQENPSGHFDCTIEYLNAVQRGEFNLDKFEEAAKRDELKGTTHYVSCKRSLI